MASVGLNELRVCFGRSQPLFFIHFMFKGLNYIDVNLLDVDVCLMSCMYPGTLHFKRKDESVYQTC